MLMINRESRASTSPHPMFYIVRRRGFHPSSFAGDECDPAFSLFLPNHRKVLSMLRFVIATSVLMSALQARGSAAQKTFVGTIGDRFFEETVRDEDLRGAPAWLEVAVNPPLSARAAIKAATAIKNSLVKDSGRFTWTLTSLSLRTLTSPPTSRSWYWVAHFYAVPNLRPGEGLGGGLDDLYIVVLMNGTALKPIIKNE
jgi:hypothetical protein